MLYLGTTKFKIIRQRYLNTEDVIPIILLALSTIAHLICINYGKPYHIHPDESYIYTDALKVCSSYFEGRFQSEWNLSMTSTFLWTPVVFVLGILTDIWSSFDEFKTAFIAGDFDVLHYYRILSVLLVLAGNLLLLRIVNNRIKDSFLRLSFLSMAFFNGLFLATNIYIKIDSLAYFCTIAYLYVLLRNNVLTRAGKHSLRSFPLLTLLSMGRVDVLVLHFFVSAFIIYQIFREKNGGVLPLLKYTGICMLVYCAITLKPVVLFYRYMHPAFVTETWESFGTIVAQSTASVFSSLSFSQMAIKVFRHFIETANIFILLTPTVLLLFILKPSRTGIILILSAITVLGVFALVGVSNFPRHRMLPFLLLFLSMIMASNVNSMSGVKKGILSLLLILQIAPYAIIAYKINIPNNYRSQLRDYILTHTSKDDVIAQASYGIDGYSIEILSSAEYYRTLAKSSLATGAGTGQKALYKSKLKNLNRRTIIPVLNSHLILKVKGDSRIQRILHGDTLLAAEEEYADVLSFSFFECSDKFRASKYYINRDLGVNDCIKENFILEKVFSPKPAIIPWYTGLINNMLFKVDFYVWKNKKYLP
ncbi:MAG: hypothetical protein EPN85_00945 [Bacteroidetes bacterium]|nr:MAG: hypothetical protein EPN85_00945 [Bacteroidota bacterium]